MHAEIHLCSITAVLSAIPLSAPTLVDVHAERLHAEHMHAEDIYTEHMHAEHMHGTNEYI